MISDLKKSIAAKPAILSATTFLILFLFIPPNATIFIFVIFDKILNFKKPKKNKGSAIFIHLTKNYKPTSGCIALKEKDFLILAKLVKKNTKILIS